MITTSLYSQDLVYKKDGKTIKAKVSEITEGEISYKMFNNPDGPLFKLSTDKIRKLVFENGSVYAFVEEKSSHNLPIDAPLKDLLADGNNVFIIMEDPTNSFDEKDAYIREYIPEYTNWNIVESLEEADFILFIEVHKTSPSHMHYATPSIRRPDGSEVWKGKTCKATPVAPNGFKAVRGVSKLIVKKALMEDLMRSISH